MDYQIQDEEQEPEEIHLLDYLRTLSKRKAVVLAFFFFIVGVMAVYVFTATRVYVGTTSILVDMERNQSLNFLEGGGAIIQVKDPAAYFNTQKDLITSRTFADRVVRKLQLDKNAYFLEMKNRRKNKPIPRLTQNIMSLFPEKARPQNPFQDPVLLAELDPQLTDIVINNVEMEIPKQNNVFKINYYADNPAVAATLANGIADVLIEYNLDIRVKPYRAAAEWLSARLVESKQQVEDTEKTLQKYREGKGVVSFEASENVITKRFQQLYAELVETEGKRQEAEIRYRQIESVINTPERLAAVPDIMNNQVIQGLRNDELGVKKQISELSEKYGPKHPQVINAGSQLTAVQKNIIAEARKMLTAFKTEFEIAKSRETSLQRTIEVQKQEVLDLTRKAINYNVLSGESVSNKQFYDLLLKKYQEASLSSGVDVSNIQVVDRAFVRKTPVKPRSNLYLLLSVIAGAIGGIFAAFFVDYLDDTLKTLQDVEKYLKLPLLDIVPMTASGKGPVYMLRDPQEPAAEAFRMVRSALMFSDSVHPLKVILIASAVPDEGKSMASVNLAVAMAQMGEKVLLMDCDMRGRSLHGLLGRHNDAGIIDVIKDPDQAPDAIQILDDCPNLHFLSTGQRAPNPSELLGSRKMKTFMAGIREHYDRVIIDSPPALLFSDPLVLAGLSDGVILVAWGGKTRRVAVQKAIHRIGGTGARIIGVILNKLDISHIAYYAYYSHYHADGKGGNRKKS